MEFLDQIEAEYAAGPRLDWFLRIRPPPAAAAFWASEECISWGHQVYGWSFCAFLIFFPVVFRRLVSSPQTRLIVINEVAMTLDIGGLVMWHLLSAKWSPHARVRARTALVQFHRVLDFMFTAGMTFHIRTLLSTQSIQAVADQVMYEHPDSLVVSLRNAFATTGARVVLQHSVHTPLPFIPQLVLATGYALLCFGMQLPVAVHILTSVGPTNHLYTLCQNINEVQSLVEATLLSTPMPMDYREQVCVHHHATVIAIFVELLAAFAAVYIAYRLEWYAKMKFILRVRGYEPPVCVSFPVGIDILFVVGYVTFAWNLVVCYHGTFMRLSMPL